MDIPIILKFTFISYRKIIYCRNLQFLCVYNSYNGKKKILLAINDSDLINIFFNRIEQAQLVSTRLRHKHKITY